MNIIYTIILLIVFTGCSYLLWGKLRQKYVNTFEIFKKVSNTVWNVIDIICIIALFVLIFAFNVMDNLYSGIIVVLFCSLYAGLKQQVKAIQKET